MVDLIKIVLCFILYIGAILASMYGVFKAGIFFYKRNIRKQEQYIKNLYEKY